MKVPYLPQDIPFNEDQKQWLGGFFAGLHTRLLVTEQNVPQQSHAPVIKPVTIIYGSQTGNAESVAYEAAECAKNQGLAPQVFDMDDVSLEQLAQSSRLLVVTSTYGEGEMPDNAESLWQAISEDNAPSFSNTFFSVLSLGDTSYDEYCLAGKLWDERLQALGATRVYDRVDCDVDYEEAAQEWSSAVSSTIAEHGTDDTGALSAPAPSSKKSQYNRKNPLQAELLTKRVLTGAGSSKEIVHYEFSLAGSGETYNAGDALNVISENAPDLCSRLLDRLNVSGDDLEAYHGEDRPLKALFQYELEIRTPSKELLQALAELSGDTELTALLNNEDSTPLNDFLWGKDILDLLGLYPNINLTPTQLVSLLKPLQPRAYSISSSNKAHPEEVHLTIGSVRYQNGDREYKGVCSTFLADLVDLGTKVKCYFAPNKHFAVPKDEQAAMIMVGPGTGIAPFRAFLEERGATGASGKNWLIFGDRNSASDFIYQDELEAMQSSGVLNRLDLAFSRDQAEKVYVQDKMNDSGKELFDWLEQGAYFYVCGDAFYMAKDVDKTLHQIVATHGELSESDAQDYVEQLKKQKRYVRDVY